MRWFTRQIFESRMDLILCPPQIKLTLMRQSPPEWISAARIRVCEGQLAPSALLPQENRVMLSEDAVPTESSRKYQPSPDTKLAVP